MILIPKLWGYFDLVRAPSNPKKKASRDGKPSVCLRRKPFFRTYHPNPLHHNLHEGGSQHARNS